MEIAAALCSKRRQKVAGTIYCNLAAVFSIEVKWLSSFCGKKKK